jgi:hypothetical protein
MPELNYWDFSEFKLFLGPKSSVAMSFLSRMPNPVVVHQSTAGFLMMHVSSKSHP